MEYLVLDTAAFINNAQIIGKASHLVTIQEVLDEVRDKKSVQFMESLPDIIEVKTPDSQSLLRVMKDARKLGDLGYLSKTDIKLLALAYQLTALHDPNFKDTHQQENVKEPAPPAEAQFTPIVPITVPVKPVQPGISFADMIRKGKPADPPQQKPNSEERQNSVNGNESSDSKTIEINKDEQIELKDKTENIEPKEIKEEAKIETNVNNEIESDQINEDQIKENNETEEGHGEEGEGEGEESEEESDDGEWITPDNLREHYLKDRNEVESDEIPIIGLMTTDFCVQNVCMSLGLRVISIEGKCISQLRKWILRCHGCFQMVMDTTRQFCPSCGSGDTLKKISYSLNRDGEMQLFINFKKRIVTKGTNMNPGKPRGGKHGTNKRVILREDQLVNCGRVYDREKQDRKFANSLTDEDWTWAPKKVNKKITHVPLANSFYSAHRNGFRRPHK